MVPNHSTAMNRWRKPATNRTVGRQREGSATGWAAAARSRRNAFPSTVNSPPPEGASWQAPPWLLGPVQKRCPEEQPQVVLLLPDEELPPSRHVLPGKLPLLDGASPPEVDPAPAAGPVDQFRAIPRRVDVSDEGPQVVVHDHPRADLDPASFQELRGRKTLGGHHDHTAADLFAGGGAHESGFPIGFRHARDVGPVLEQHAAVLDLVDDARFELPRDRVAEPGLARLEPDHVLSRLPQDPARLDREVARSVHDRDAGPVRAVPDPPGVVQGVEREDRAERFPEGNGHDRLPPRGNEEEVVPLLGPVFKDHAAAYRVHLPGALPFPILDALRAKVFPLRVGRCT